MKSTEVSVDNLYSHLKQFGPGEHTTPICLVNTTGNHFKYYNIVVQVVPSGLRPFNKYIIQISYGRINKKPKLREQMFVDTTKTATWINQKFLQQRSKGYVLLDKDKFYVEPCVGPDIAESKFITETTTYITYKKVSVDEVPKGKSKKEAVKDKRFNDLIFE
jgi:predicted DNA-binding WGR domain protein